MHEKPPGPAVDARERSRAQRWSLPRAARLTPAGGRCPGEPGWASPCRAQHVSSSVPKARSLLVCPGPGRPGPARLKPAQARWAEINVELALLAEETTFIGQLFAHVEEGQLVLSGTVSSEPARQRALELARIHGTLPVRDFIHIEPGQADKLAQDANMPLKLKSKFRQVLAVNPQAAQKPAIPLNLAASQLLAQHFKERALRASRSFRRPGASCTFAVPSIPSRRSWPSARCSARRPAARP